MARKAANRPVNTDTSILQTDFSNLQVPTQFQQEPEEELGFFDKLANSGKAIIEGIGFLPGGVAETIQDAWNGGHIDVTDTQALEDRMQRRKELSEYAKKWEGKTFEGVTSAMESIPYSLTTMGGTILAGLAAAPTGPFGATAAGMAASGKLAYDASKQQFMHNHLEKFQQVMGRMPTQEEWNNIESHLDEAASEYGMWEAIPEAVGNALFAKILGPVGKSLTRPLTGTAARAGEDAAAQTMRQRLVNAGARFAGAQAEEQATETVTQKGQGDVEYRTGLRDKAPTWGQAFTEQAPTTFWQTTIMGAGKGGLDLMRDRFRKQSGTDGVQQGADTPDQQQPAAPTQAPNPTAQNSFDEFGWNGEGGTPLDLNQQWAAQARERGFDQFQDRVAADWTHFNDDDVKYVKYGGRWWIVNANGNRIGISDEASEDVESRWREYNRPLEVLYPEVVGEQPVVGIGMPGYGNPALPGGTGAMPMGTNDAGLDTIATPDPGRPAEIVNRPPTEVRDTTPITTPYVPNSQQQGIPAQTGTAPEGRWPGGRGDLSYPYGPHETRTQAALRSKEQFDILNLPPEDVHPAGQPPVQNVQPVQPVQPEQATQPAQGLGLIQDQATPETTEPVADEVGYGTGFNRQIQDHNGHPIDIHITRSPDGLTALIETRNTVTGETEAYAVDGEEASYDDEHLAALYLYSKQLEQQQQTVIPAEVVDDQPAAETTPPEAAQAGQAPVENIVPAEEELIAGEATPSEPTAEQLSGIPHVSIADITGQTLNYVKVDDSWHFIDPASGEISPSPVIPILQTELENMWQNQGQESGQTTPQQAGTTPLAEPSMEPGKSAPQDQQEQIPPQPGQAESPLAEPSMNVNQPIQGLGFVGDQGQSEEQQSQGAPESTAQGQNVEPVQEAPEAAAQPQAQPQTPQQPVGPSMQAGPDRDALAMDALREAITKANDTDDMMMQWRVQQLQAFIEQDNGVSDYTWRDIEREIFPYIGRAPIQQPSAQPQPQQGEQQPIPQPQATSQPTPQTTEQPQKPKTKKPGATARRNEIKAQLPKEEWDQIKKWPLSKIEEYMAQRGQQNVQQEQPVQGQQQGGENETGNFTPGQTAPDQNSLDGVDNAQPAPDGASYSYDFATYKKENGKWRQKSAIDSEWRDSTPEESAGHEEEWRRREKIRRLTQQLSSEEQDYARRIGVLDKERELESFVIDEVKRRRAIKEQIEPLVWEFAKDWSTKRLEEQVDWLKSDGYKLAQERSQKNQPAQTAQGTQAEDQDLESMSVEELHNALPEALSHYRNHPSRDVLIREIKNNRENNRKFAEIGAELESNGWTPVQDKKEFQLLDANGNTKAVFKMGPGEGVYDVTGPMGGRTGFYREGKSFNDVTDTKAEAADILGLIGSVQAQSSQQTQGNQPKPNTPQAPGNRTRGAAPDGERVSFNGGLYVKNAGNWHLLNDRISTSEHRELESQWQKENNTTENAPDGATITYALPTQFSGKAGEYRKYDGSWYPFDGIPLEEVDAKKIESAWRRQQNGQPNQPGVTPSNSRTREESPDGARVTFDGVEYVKIHGDWHFIDKIVNNYGNRLEEEWQKKNQTEQEAPDGAQVDNGYEYIKYDGAWHLVSSPLAKTPAKKVEAAWRREQKQPQSSQPQNPQQSAQGQNQNQNQGGASSSAESQNTSQETSQETPQDVDYGTPEKPNIGALSDYFKDRLANGTRYPSIHDARKEVVKLLKSPVKPATEAAKQLEEAIELGVVKAGRKIVEDGHRQRKSDKEIFNALVDLYQRQPILGSRTSTSVQQQAYSTPIPLAFLASRLAGINSNTNVYEPTAGNGMLLVEANTRRTEANELNPGRAERLRSIGFNVSEENALEHDTNGKVDVIIANPPFGRVYTEDGKGRETFTVNDFTTKELDHAIIAKALQSLKDHGKAVLIIGGKKGNEEERMKKYRGSTQVNFYRHLFDNYNVLDHFSVDGKLYARQGASYPIDIIVLEAGRKTENAVFPGGQAPRVYSSFEELGGLLNGQEVQVGGTDTTTDNEAAGESGAGDNRPSDSVHGNRDAKNDGSVHRPGGDKGGEPGNTGRPGPRNGGNVRGENGTGQLGGLEENSSEQLGGIHQSAESERDTGSDTEEQTGRTDRPSTKGGSGEHGHGSVRGSKAGHSGVDSDATSNVEKKPRKKPEKETSFQVSYQASSKQKSLDTLIPKGMADAAAESLKKVAKEHGDIDSYVASELGYKVEELGNYFSAEQVDAIALAIHHIANGDGFIIGDQTGIGKGRINAAMIRWVQRQNKIPVFVTLQPELYGDMIRDLTDIGMPGFNPLVTNNDLKKDKAIPLPDGRILTTGNQKKKLEKVVNEGKLGDEYGAVFTTYHQLQSMGNKPNPRKDFIAGIAKHSVFILDESHNAAGEEKKDGRENDSETIGTFMKKVLEDCPNGTFYSSATYAKRPSVMGLYLKTNMRHAVNDESSLGEVIAEGGIPMQQIAANMLSQDGQYLRRERSYEGADVDTKIIKANEDLNNECSDIMQKIQDFNILKEIEAKKIIKDQAKHGKDAVGNAAVGTESLQSINFSSVMHNLIDQIFMAQKVEQIVESVTEDVNNGLKPVIALTNTMESMIKRYAQANGLSVGDETEITFKDLFKDYLRKTRLLVTKEKGEVVDSRMLTDEELGTEAVEAYKEAERAIEDADIEQMEVSFIDAIEAGLRRNGIKVEEITGRKMILDMSSHTPKLAARDDTSRTNVINGFNNGDIDVVILNAAGSTGISLHSSEKFRDQRRRVMYIAQPAKDINVFMQTLGRVFRTGQVVPPAYKLLFTDIPAEKRAAAVLAKKMASLNANTTAAKDSDTTFKDIPDFLNKYGNEVAREFVQENTELAQELGIEDLEFDKAMQKLTGHIPLLPVKKQKEVYENLESAYKEYIEMLKSTGEYDLEATTLDLNARLEGVNSELVAKKDVGVDTPFAEAAYIGEYSVKKLGKPHSPEKVNELISNGESLDLGLVETKVSTYLGTLDDTDEKKYLKISSRVKNNLREIIEISGIAKKGTLLTIEKNGETYEGIVTNVVSTGKSKSPVALSDWRLELAIADATKKMVIPFNKIKTFNIERSNLSREEFDDLLRKGASESREKRVIVTGNIIAGYENLMSRHLTGRLTFFTTAEGETIPGIILSKKAEIDKILNSNVIPVTPTQAIDFLRDTKVGGDLSVTTQDGKFVVEKWHAGYTISVPASKKDGGLYFLNKGILDALGQDFVRSGKVMRVNTVSETRLENVLTVMTGQGFGFVAKGDIKKAKKIVQESTQSTQTDNGFENGPDISASIADTLSPSRNTRQRVRLSELSALVDKLNEIAKNASKSTTVVQSVSELPEHVRQGLGDKAELAEGAYDASTDTMYLVADNITDLDRAARVWAHEQIGHHGINSLFKTKGDKVRFMNSLYAMSGASSLELTKEIARQYRDANGGESLSRAELMEEVIAHLAEKRALKALSQAEESVWKKFLRALKNLFQRFFNNIIGIQATPGDLEQLIDMLESHVMDGVPNNAIGQARLDYVSDGSIKGALRTKPAPKKTVKAYKLFRVDKRHPGELFPLFVGADKSVEIGVWHDAEIGAMAKGGKVKSKLGPLAMRPGWHAGDFPIATHIGAKANATDSAPSFRPDDQVWAEVEMAADVDWQAEANSRASRTKAGKIIARTAHITDQVPEDGFYRYKTNSNMTGQWLISGAMKVNRVLTDEEVERINKEGGVADLPRRTPFKPEEWGFKLGENLKASLVVKDRPVASVKTVRVREPKDQSQRFYLHDVYTEESIEKVGARILDTGNADPSNMRLADMYRSILAGTTKVNPPKQRSSGNVFASLSPTTDSQGNRNALGKVFDKIYTMGNQELLNAAQDNDNVEQFVPKEDLDKLSAFVSLPHWLAKRFPKFKEIYDRQVARADERSRRAKESLEEVPLLFGKDRLGKKDMDSLNELLWSMEGKHHLDENGVEKFVVDRTTPSGREIIKINPAFYSVYDGIIDASKATPKAKEAMKQIRRSLDNDLMKAHNRMAEMDGIHDDAIRKFRSEIGEVPNYFPHNRYGKYFFAAKDESGTTVYREHYDAVNERDAQIKANAIRNRIRGDYPNATFKWGVNRQLPEEVLGAPIDTGAMEQLLKEAVRGIQDKDTRESVFNALAAGTSNLLKARGFGEHAIKRKNIPGFVKDDITKVLYDYKMGLNGWLTKMDAARDFGQSLGKIRAVETPELWKYASTYVRDMLRNSDKVDRIVGNLKTFFFMHYLGGNLKTATVNATQNLIVGIPRMAMDIPSGRVGLWLRAAGDAITNALTKGKTLQGEEARLIKELWGENVITDRFMEEVRGHITKDAPVVGPMSKALNMTAKILGAPMSVVEKFNRTSLALAVFRAARAGNIRPSTRAKLGIVDGRLEANYDEAKELAKEIVMDSHFVYGKTNMPETFRGESKAGRALSSAYTFRSFSHNMLSMWKWALSGENRKNGGARLFAESIGVTAALGGMAALPFFATLSALCTAATGDDEDWMTKAKRYMKGHNTMSDIVCYGLPSLAGVNIGGSLAMETPATTPLKKGGDVKDIISNVLWNTLGIPGAVIESSSKAVSAHHYGKDERALEELSPVFVKNLIAARRLYTEGQTSLKGAPIGEQKKIDTSGAILKAAGFQPVSMTKGYEEYAAGKLVDARRSDQIDKLVALELKAKDTGDAKYRVEMFKELRNWNAEHDRAGKSYMRIAPKEVFRRAKSRRAVRKGSKASQGMKSAMGW